MGVAFWSVVLSVGFCVWAMEVGVWFVCRLESNSGEFVDCSGEGS